MLRLNLYLWRNLSQALALSIGIATFLMVVAGVAGEERLLGLLLAQGIAPVGKFILYRLPEVLAYTIPLGTLAATVLVINRMSADNEIVALRASGIGMLQILTPLVIFALALSIFCWCMQGFFMPTYKHRARAMLQSEAIRNPLAFLEPGHFVEMFPGYIVYVGSMKDGHVEDVHIYILRSGAVRQYVIANSGSVDVDEVDKRIWLRLENAMITTVDPDSPNDAESFHRLHSSEAAFPLDYGSQDVSRRALLRRDGEMTIPQLFSRIAIYAEQNIPTTALLVLIHKRAACSLAPLSFLLVGLGFGIRSGRRDTSSGLVACLVVALVYYGGVIGVETFENHAALHPELLIWLPNIACQSLGLFWIWRKQ